MVFVEIFDLFHMDGSKPTEAFIYFDLSLPKPTLRQPRVGICLPRPNGSAAYVCIECFHSL
jgi:hypothetical protein